MDQPQTNIFFWLLSRSLLDLMIFVFIAGALLRVMIYVTVWRHEWFTQEFDKRIRYFMDYQMKEGPRRQNFHDLTKKLLEKTFYEAFKVRSIMKRRSPDYLLDPIDRLFVVKQGSGWLCREVLRQVKHYNKKGFNKTHEMVKTIFQNNPGFSKIFGIIPVGTMTEFTNLLPGLFVIGGILGTFLGISNALPELAKMDLNDPEKTKAAIDLFLVAITFKMSSSIYGILCSVAFSLLNTWLSPEKVFIKSVDTFENCLDSIWSISVDGDEEQTTVVSDIDQKDPMEAMAADFLKEEMDRLLVNEPPRAKTLPKAS